MLLYKINSKQENPCRTIDTSISKEIEHVKVQVVLLISRLDHIGDVAH